jgi:uncharacterized membrane protein YhaH (DUF805 family)
MEWMLLPLRRYAEFTGRSRRKEFWMFFLFQLLAGAALSILFGTPDYMAGGGMFAFSSVMSGTGSKVQALFNLALLIPNFAVAVRRLHDIDRSGWFLLLILIPFLGWFTLFVMYCLDGNRGYNRYGPDPKNPTDIDAFS